MHLFYTFHDTPLIRDLSAKKDNCYTIFIPKQKLGRVESETPYFLSPVKEVNSLLSSAVVSHSFRGWVSRMVRDALQIIVCSVSAAIWILVGHLAIHFGLLKCFCADMLWLFLQTLRYWNGCVCLQWSYNKQLVGCKLEVTFAEGGQLLTGRNGKDTQRCRQINCPQKAQCRTLSACRTQTPVTDYVWNHLTARQGKSWQSQHKQTISYSTEMGD